ncbi:SDR family oxidoreductase [Marinococcus sp. PL1-022]|uniref:SDR family oxidoreductase n=1 Tax=Marinococcus sp. PL1-022 TaxID=3095363 RepID=UPI0029C38325|nr:SDR family oxidoreductase [Marinococcus sp. PL1-022]MDX6152735.1 SDR family oxidoreductase [Marinococcus sp. PL1-022]
MQTPFQIPLEDKVVVITGGSGVLGSVMAEALAANGAKVAIIARNKEKVEQVARRISENGGEAAGYSGDVTDKQAMEAIYEDVKSRFGPCDILVNGAGGNNPKATTGEEYFNPEAPDSGGTFFDLDPVAVDQLFSLNFLGALIPSQVFTRDMVYDRPGSIINISSMNAYRPLTKIPAYSGAKAAVSNFTQWLAVYFSKSGVRVNAMAPGFFLTDQNRELMFSEEGVLSARAEKILSQTPQERFGEPEELVGTLLWLVDEKSSGFVNGIVVPIDGGFSAYSGV